MTLTALLIDITMCFLLGAAAIMCWRVDQRFRAMRAGQDGLNETITSLNEAVERSRASLSALDRAAKDQGANLKSEVDAARKLADELRFLVDQGESIATNTAARRRAATPRYEPASTVGDDEAETAQRRRLEGLKALR